METSDIGSTTEQQWRRVGVAEVADRDLSKMLPGITDIGYPKVIPTSYEVKERIRKQYGCQEVTLKPIDGYPLRNVEVYIR